MPGQKINGINKFLLFPLGHHCQFVNIVDNSDINESLRLLDKKEILTWTYYWSL